MNAILHPTLVSALNDAPSSSDQNRASETIEHWVKNAGDLRASDIADIEQGRVVLASLFNFSPYLTNCSNREPRFLIQCFVQGVDTVFESLLQEIQQLVPRQTNRFDLDRLSIELRRARRQASLLIAFAEITGVWNTQRAASAQSLFADKLVTSVIDGLLVMANNAGDIDLENQESPSDGSGLIVLGLGKLGGNELNYSSDIDLMVLYDLECCRLISSIEPRDFFVRLARHLVQILATRTGDGYVFRTDLRLRPDPGATPLAISTIAAETYYESLGQNWERAALIKARPIAGDYVAASNFLEAVEPFIWRKSLDFAAIEDIHSIKRQIHAHRGNDAIAIEGHNIKLGRGGIREIEFFAQTQQLIWGGRSRKLRVRSTCDALVALAGQRRISEEVCGELVNSYWFLRRIENRLQMVDDSQTHTIPDSDQKFQQFTEFLGYRNASLFSSDLGIVLNKIANHYSDLFESSPELIVQDNIGGSLVFTGVDDDPATLNTLRRMGYHRPEVVTDTIRAWHHGRLRATRSNRSRQILTQLMPILLTAFSKTAEPEVALLNFDKFLSNLPAGVQLFSLFQAHPKLLDIVAEIMGTAPRLAEYLTRQTHLLESVIEDSFFDLPAARQELQASLGDELNYARDFQDILDITRTWSGDVKFKVSVQHLRRLIRAEEANKALSDVADVLIEAVLKAVETEFHQTYGKIENGEFAVVGFGKLGSQMMTRGSDLDLVFIYRAPENAISDGPRGLGASHYYARLCQRLITALSVQTGRGQLYEVDMRLRPMGPSGPLVSEFSRLEYYYENEAWIWELMALTRARVIVAPNKLNDLIRHFIKRTLCRKRDPGELASKICEIHEKVVAEKGTTDMWAIKNVPGGLFDLEFIVQYLLLRDASIEPNVLNSNTIVAIQNLSKVNSISSATASQLLDAGRLFLNLQSIMRIAVAGKFQEENSLDGLRQILVRASEATDFVNLKEMLEAAERYVATQFKSIIREAAAVFAAGNNKKNEKN